MHSFMTSLWFTHRWRTNNCRVLKKNRKIKLKIIFLIWSDQQCRRPEPPFRSGSGSASSPTFRERQGCRSLSEPGFLGGAGAEFSSRLRFRLQLSCQYRKKIFFVVPTKKLKISVFSVIFALKQFSKKLKNLHLLLIFVSVKKKTKNVQFFPLTLGVGVGVGARSGFGNLTWSRCRSQKSEKWPAPATLEKEIVCFFTPHICLLILEGENCYFSHFFAN